MVTPLTVTSLQLQQVLHQKKHPTPEIRIAWENTQYICQLLSTSAHQSQVFKVKNCLEKIKGLIATPPQIELVFETQIVPRANLLGPELYLQEALLCLINNAFEAIDQVHGGKVTLSCRQNGDQLNITIQDTGSGMDWVTLKLAQIPGLTFKHQGTGIGLTFAKYTITKHFGGTLSIASKPKHGTTITIRLPLHL